MLIVILVIIAVLVVIAIGIYNTLVVKRNRVKNGWSQIDVQLKRRIDLIPNLVETVKGYAAHEKAIFERIAEARSLAINAKGPAESASANNQLNDTLKTLFAVVENYPNLKANENFRDLQAQLEGTENRIAVARKRYIDAVMGYNKAVRFFPTNLTAKYILHLELRETFQPEGQPIERPPEVKF